MGCVTSSVNPQTPQAEVKTGPKTDVIHGNNVKENGFNPPQNQNANNSNNTRALSPAAATAKATSFEVQVADDKESIIKKHPPKRLLKLETLEKSKLTAEELAEKLRSAEEKRQRALESRAKTASASRRSSKRARELLAAKEFEKQQQQSEEIDKKHASAGKQREIQQQIAIERSRLREEKSRLVLERRKRMENEDDGVDYELEKDENFNETDDTLWSGTDDSTAYEQTGDYVYSGRDSPKKGSRAPGRSLQPRNSASTVDSCDVGYRRSTDNGRNAAHFLNDGVHGDQNDDGEDFFDKKT